MNDSINDNVKNNDNKGITLVLIGILTVISAIAGATFAFFQASASATFSGGSAYDSTPLTLSITDKTASSVGSGDTGKKLNPVYDEQIQNTITSQYGSCVNESGQALCKVYSITVTNTTTTNFYLSGEITFSTTGSMPNLKWAKGTSATTGFPSTESGTSYYAFGSSAETTLATPFFLTKSGTAGASQTFYIAVWISETGEVQTDSGKFTGTVTFNGYSDENKSLQGVTSTITSAD